MIAGRVTRVVNPRKRSAPRKKASARPNHRRRSVNPAYLMTLGPMINPKRSTMAKKAKNKKSYARRPKLNSYARRNKKNAKKSRALTSSRVAAFAKSHGMKVIKKRSNHGRSRNPLASSISLSRPAGIVQATVGVLVGVAATKAITAALPSNITSDALYSTAAATAIAAGLWWIGSFINPEFGAAAGLGGIAEAGSIGLNAFLPSIGSTLALSGRRGQGDFVPGRYAVPQNPILDAATGLPKRQAMVVSAYPKAYGAA